ncbi:hypothetical protein [Nonomuraea sp. B19D2]|uniref:hypothetical protein n=1 Tax=Nonomuraea sp. B19D2 TaxID=3159561 RepID=UPI0032DA1AA4
MIVRIANGCPFVPQPRFGPGGSPCIGVLSGWTTVILSTVDGSSSRTSSTSLTVAAYIRATDRASASMFAAGNSAARQPPVT